LGQRGSESESKAWKIGPEKRTWFCPEDDFSPGLKRRIEAGDPFDVAILPPDVAEGLAQRGRLVAASRVDLGRTGLGVAVRKDAPIPDISTVDAFRSALLAAPTVAYADGGASSVRI
jgi:molybdate transport system substrate-binding protein